MNTMAYVRTEMAPSRAAPIRNVGLVGWCRQNLFGSWLNTTLTVICLMAIGMLLLDTVPWMVQSSWTATSLNECRAQIAEFYGEGTHGACWAVIRERYLQMFYGFYPSDGYWRPNLALILMLVAISPVLFPSVPRKLLWFSAFYPFLCVWLLWGGSFWPILMVLAGFAVGYWVMTAVGKGFGALAGFIVGITTTFVWWFYIAGWLAGHLQSGLTFLYIEPVESARFGGFMLSTTIGVTGIACSLPIGILLALGRKSDLLIVKAICVGFIEFIRGVPLITLLFVASVLLNIFLPPGTTFDLILRVIIMVTLFASAYIAEVVRGGLASLPRGQFEAADALGLDYWKSMRLVVLPQALKVSIPGIVSTFIGLFKDTTLVSIIGLFDPLNLTNAIRADANWNGVVWELYAFVAVIFFILCFAMSRYSMYLERRLQTGRD